ncbi:MAG: TenA family transcriptional regulator [Vibrionaceae bacterium]
MSFYQILQKETAKAREEMMSAPIIGACLRGEELSLDTYIDFLTQAYHHVSHTVPLLMATGGKLPQKYNWVRKALVDYINEEHGHQEWILSDIRACGYDETKVRDGKPALAIELMVAFLYDQIARGNPMGFFGMVYVLEGTSTNIAIAVSEQLKAKMGLKAEQMSYLISHGNLDIEHMKFFEKLMDKVSDPLDQAAIIHAARVVFKLYGDMLHGLKLAN